MAITTRPEVIVFDLGKVLVDFDYSISSRRLAAASDRSPEEIQDFIDHSPLLFEYETGKMTSQEFFDRICQKTGYEGTFEDFREFFADIFTPIDAMIDLHAQLKALGFPTFIFSNTNELAIHHIRSRFPFFSGFDDYIYSYEHRSMKPDAGLYEVVEERTGRSGKAILYFDDRPENIEAGRNRGWQAAVHRDAAETRELCRQGGLIPT